jgi:hypothetical protein
MTREAGVVRRAVSLEGVEGGPVVVSTFEKVGRGEGTVSHVV